MFSPELQSNFTLALKRNRGGKAGAPALNRRGAPARTVEPRGAGLGSSRAARAKGAGVGGTVDQARGATETLFGAEPELKGVADFVLSPRQSEAANGHIAVAQQTNNITIMLTWAPNMAIPFGTYNGTCHGGRSEPTGPAARNAGGERCRTHCVCRRREAAEAEGALRWNGAEYLSQPCAETGRGRENAIVAERLGGGRGGEESVAGRRAWYPSGQGTPVGEEDPGAQ